MPTAIRAITRIQDSDDFAGTPGAATDVYALTYDNASRKFVLTQHVTAADPHTGYLLATGARAGGTSQEQKFGRYGISIAYDSSNLTTFVTNSAGNLTITPSGRGMTTKVLHVGDLGISGGNTEILSVQKSYDSTEIDTSPNMFEGHAKWLGDADAPTKVLRGGALAVQGWSTKEIRELTGFLASSLTLAATPIVQMMIGLHGTASTSFAGSSTPLGYGVRGGAYAIIGTMTKAVGLRGEFFLPAPAASTTTGIAISGYIDPLQGGSVASAIGIQSELASAVGTITDYYGFKLEALPASTPTITNAYGLYLPAITLGTSLNYAIYAAGGPSYFGGTVSVAYDSSNLTTLATDSSGNLTITPSGRGMTTKVLHVGDTGVSGGNTEILSVQKSYDSTEIDTSPNMFEGITKWIGTAADAPTRILRGGTIAAQGWSTKQIRELTGFLASSITLAATPIVESMIGLHGTASTSFAGSSTPLGYGVRGGAYAIIGTMTKAVGLRGEFFLPAPAASTTTGIAISGYIDPLQGGSVASAIGIQSELASAVGTITDYYGFKLEALPASTPTITNAYGLYLPAITLGTSLNYAIYAAGGPSYFGGTVSVAYDSSNLTTLATDSSGNLTITPSGRGMTTKVLHVGDTGVSGGNTEILSVQKSYDSTEIDTSPNMFEGITKWIGTAADAPTRILRGGTIAAQGWSTKQIRELTGFLASSITLAATPIVESMIGLHGTASTSFAGSSTPLGYGVRGGAYAIIGTMTKAVGLRGEFFLPAPAASTTTGIAISGYIDPLQGGSVASAIGIQSELASAVGTITDYYGFKLEALPASTPTITNAYGLYLPAITLGTSLNYAIYAAGGPSYFGGNVGIATPTPASRLDLAAGALTMSEMSAPAAPAANSVVIYAVDNGAGKTQLMARFASGGVQQIAIEP